MQIRFLHGNYYVLFKNFTKSRTAAGIVNEASGIQSLVDKLPKGNSIKAFRR
jgi:hypothetical protein